jgi:methyl-accepting chemotaxis protein
MSDQIILEFIGDPSGLRPAEEALKELNKATQQTIIAFTKANDAIKKFATTAKETKSAAKEAGEHTEKSVKSLSNLTKTINAGTVKSLIMMPPKIRTGS